MLICVPENQNLPTREFYVLQRGVLEFCKEHSAFAILDVPKTTTQNFRNDLANYRAQLSSDSLSQGAAFFPNLRTVYNYLYDESTLKIKKGRWEFEMSSLKKSDPVRYAKYKSALQQFFVSLPPSAAVAGAFLKTDETRGIWKAPANIALSDILNPEIAINNIDQDFLYIDATSGLSLIHI